MTEVIVKIRECEFCGETTECSIPKDEICWICIDCALKEWICE